LAEDLNLVGQTAILVGGTDGIGLACAHILLQHNLSTLVLGSRNMEKGNRVAKELKEQHPSADVRVWELEMLSFDSVQLFAERCVALPRIDFAIIGAGNLPAEFKINPSTGHEVTMQVHYWSTALLALLLLPALKQKHPEGKPGHLTIVDSDLALIAGFKERDAVPLLPEFDKPVPWQPTERYNTCKLLIMMLVLKLKDVVSPSEVIVNSVCPGMSKPTAIERDQPWLGRLVPRILRTLLGRPLEASAWTYIDAAVEQGADSHGSHLASWHVSP
jgi:NAD(P)-dependent dehydrogenase (short-subunit alcohol dehydrogenase family)